MSKEVKDYTNNMLISDFNLICNELLPADKELFIEKYINKKSNKELKVSSIRISNLDSKLERIIGIIKCRTLVGISESLLRYRCKNLGLDREKTEFAIDCFCNDLTRKELADKYILAPETVKKYKSKLRKILENL